MSSSLFSERFKPTTRGVYPPSFQGQPISFRLGVLCVSLQQETKKRGQNDCNYKEKTLLEPTAKEEGQNSSRSKTWTTGYFETRRRATRRGYQGSPDFSHVTLVLNDEVKRVSSHLAEMHCYFCQHGGKWQAAVSKL